MRLYYQDDAVTLYHADCREVLPTLSGVDLVLTSPPYNLGVTTGGGFPLRRGKWHGAKIADGYGLHEDAMPTEQYRQWQRETLIACWGTLSESGAIYYNHKPRVQGGELVMPTEYNPGLPLRQIVIWARSGGMNFSPSFYVPSHEWILIFPKPTFRLASKGASGVGDVWYIPQESAVEHPAPFPLKLAIQAIETTPAQIVCDPFAGRGTTLRAAKDLGRKAIGIEIEERYCETAAKWCAQEVLPLGVSHAI